MAGRAHHYQATIRWRGNDGAGTRDYASYGRGHDIEVDGKPVIAASSDPAFRGDASRHNPEDLLLASLSSCHMLWYLHLAAEAGLVVVDYVDDAAATMEVRAGGGRFTEAILRPQVTLSSGDPAIADALHERAHEACFIANSVNFPVHCEPRSVLAG